MLVIRNKMPPTARRDIAAKSRLDAADGKRKSQSRVESAVISVIDNNGLREHKPKIQRETEECFSPGVTKAIIKVPVV